MATKYRFIAREQFIQMFSHFLHSTRYNRQCGVMPDYIICCRKSNSFLRGVVVCVVATKGGSTIHTPHLHPRYEAEAGRSRTNDGQLHGASDVSRKRMRNTGEGAKPPLRYSLNLSAHFRVWVTVWVRRLTHILTHTIFCVFATKKHRKPKFSMLLELVV